MQEARWAPIKEDAVRSDKVNPRLDEEQRHELSGLLQGAPIESRDDEHVQEAIGRIEPGRRPETAEASGDDISIDESAERADFSRWFERSWFPATGAELSVAAQERSAPEWVLWVLGANAKSRFESISDLWGHVRASPSTDADGGWDA
jgi:hypothetical protein